MYLETLGSHFVSLIQLLGYQLYCRLHYIRNGLLLTGHMLHKTNYNMWCEFNKIRQLACVDIETLIVSLPCCYRRYISVNELTLAILYIRCKIKVIALYFVLSSSYRKIKVIVLYVMLSSSYRIYNRTELLF